MGGRKDDLGWRPIVILAAIAIATFVAYALWPKWADYCPDTEQLAQCSREWVNALAGWAAAFAAAVTIIYLVRQNQEQKKQTDFMLGDSRPTFDVYVEHPPYVFLRIVNWNRRTFVVDRIECFEDPEMLVFKCRLEHKLGDEPLQSYSPIFRPRIRIAAFDDRSKAPAICRFEVITHFDYPKALNFVVYGRLLGDKHEVITLSATTSWCD